MRLETRAAHVHIQSADASAMLSAFLAFSPAAERSLAIRWLLIALILASNVDKKNIQSSADASTKLVTEFALGLRFWVSNFCRH